MSRYQVDKLLRDLRRDRDLAARFRENIDAVLADYEIDATECELLKRWQIRELFERGVNPLLLLLAHGTTGRSMSDYAQMMKPKHRPDGG
jgi:hypothetical protein